jgi:hypothetical protein
MDLFRAVKDLPIIPFQLYRFAGVIYICRALGGSYNFRVSFHGVTFILNFVKLGQLLFSCKFYDARIDTLPFEGP